MRPTLALLLLLAPCLAAYGLSDKTTILYAAVDDAYTAIGNTALTVSAGRRQSAPAVSQIQSTTCS